MLWVLTDGITPVGGGGGRAVFVFLLFFPVFGGGESPPWFLLKGGQGCYSPAAREGNCSTVSSNCKIGVSCSKSIFNCGNTPCVSFLIFLEIIELCLPAVGFS